MTLGDAVQRVEACLGAGSVVTVQETLVALEAARQTAVDDTGLMAVLCHRAGREFPTPLTDDARLEGMAAAEASGARDVMVLGQLLGVCSPAVSEGGFDIRPYFATEAVGPQDPASDVACVNSWLHDADLVANAVVRDVAFSVALGWAVDFDLVDKGREWLDVWHGHDGVSEWHLLYYGVLLGVVNPGDVHEALFASAGDCADRVLLSVAALADAYRASSECGLALALVPVAERSVGGVVVVESLQRVVNAYGPLVCEKAVHNHVLVSLWGRSTCRAFEIAPGSVSRVLALAGETYHWTDQPMTLVIVGKAVIAAVDENCPLSVGWVSEVHGLLATAFWKLRERDLATEHARIATVSSSGNPTAWLLESTRRLSVPDLPGAALAATRSAELTWAEKRFTNALAIAEVQLKYIFDAHGFEASMQACEQWDKRLDQLAGTALENTADVYRCFIAALPHRYAGHPDKAIIHAQAGLAKAVENGDAGDEVLGRLTVAALFQQQRRFDEVIAVLEPGVRVMEHIPRTLVVTYCGRLVAAYDQCGRHQDGDRLGATFDL